MFKAFLKKVEESTEQLGASFKSKENAPKPFDLLKKESVAAVKKLDIDVSLPSLKSQPQTQGPPPTPIHYKEDLDLHPGAEFLKKYQEKLGELHTNNVILAKKAEAVDRKLPTLVRHCTNHHEVWRRLNNELARLPELSANISNIRNQIDVILVKFDEMEILLSTQVEAYHANELAKFKENLVNDGNKFQAQKQKELANFEEELVMSRVIYERDKETREREKARIIRVEQAQQQRKKEEEEARQRKQKESEENKQQETLRSAFGNAFQHQMGQFMKFGAAVLAPKKSEPVVPVENVVPEDNPQAIEEFFNDVVKESNKSTNKSQEKENEQEKETTDAEVEKNDLVKGDEEPESERKAEATEQVEKEDSGAKVEIEEQSEQKGEQTTQEVTQETVSEKGEEKNES